MRVAIDELARWWLRALQRGRRQPGDGRLHRARAGLAEAQGLGSHGLSRVAQYATHLRNGRVDGGAAARAAAKGGAVLIDAGDGLAFAACELAVREAIARRANTAWPLPA